MNNNPNVSYLFTSSELTVMVLSMGYKNIVGFDLGRSNNDLSSMINTLNSMVNRNIYKNTDRYFHLNEPYREMIKMMCTAEEILCIKFKNNSFSDLCCYISENSILVCELAGGNKKIKLTVMSPASLWNLLNDGKCLPVPKNAESASEYETDMLLKDVNRSHEGDFLIPDMNVSVRIEKYNIVTGKRAAVVVIEKALNNYISYIKYDNIVNYVYSHEKLKEIFYDILEMKL